MGRETDRSTLLPAETRRCRQCGDPGMRATRAGLGGGWGKTGLRHVYACPACGHEVILERRATDLFAIVSGLLIVAGTAWIFFADADTDPFEATVLALFLLLGGWAMIAPLLTARRYPLSGTLPAGDVPTVPVEEHLYLSDGERARGERWERRATVIIFTIAAATVLFVLVGLLVEGS